jgi:iron complex outermembrane receptor protein
MNFRKNNLFRSRGILLLLCFAALPAAAQVGLKGTVFDRENGSPLPAAHILLEGSYHTTFTDSAGHYVLPGLPKGACRLKCTFVGYQDQIADVKLKHDTVIDFHLYPTAILGEEVNIVATRAGEKCPIAFTSVTAKEIGEVNLGKDMPYLIQASPSTVVTSDAGTGIGYTGIYIRGTDLTRINVTINGIPLNDAESQGVWFVDLPDLASSTENIQIQRGAGTSTNGAGAFGATINIRTDEAETDPYGEFSGSYGSFDTWKATLKFGSGIMKPGFSVDGRLSYLTSSGYIDRASALLKSYYLSGGYYGKHTTLRFITFSGTEKTYQAWEGVPADSLETNRTYNPAGEYTDADGNIRYYDNQTDNYQQDHYQLIFSQTLLKNRVLNLALHLTNGYGYYESYQTDRDFSDYGLEDVIIGSDTITSTNLVDRKYLDNSFYGLTFSTNYSIPDKLEAILGGSLNQYYGKHFGMVIWSEYASNGDNERHYYDNTGLKNDFTIYAKASYKILRKLTLFADLQYRHVGYSMEGIQDDLRDLTLSRQFDFFNPKAGLFYDINNHFNLYASFATAHREPSRNNYKDSDPDHMPTFETLYDYELGSAFTNTFMTASVNLYYMDYRDQLVLTGEINNVGEAIMVNVPSSSRMGIEISAGITFLRKLRWEIQATFSENRISDFIGYVDEYDAGWNFTGQKQIYYSQTDLSFSPGLIAQSHLTYKPVKGLSLGFLSKYISRQYIDNTSDQTRSLDPYFVNNFLAEYSFPLKPFEKIGLQLMINNLFGAKYESNAWVYQYYLGGIHEQMTGWFPQALINYQVGVTVKL